MNEWNILKEIKPG